MPILTLEAKYTRVHDNSVSRASVIFRHAKRTAGVCCQFEGEATAEGGAPKPTPVISISVKAQPIAPAPVGAENALTKRLEIITVVPTVLSEAEDVDTRCLSVQSVPL